MGEACRDQHVIAGIRVVLAQDGLKGALTQANRTASVSATI
jgi:hypothetical protein